MTLRDALLADTERRGVYRRGLERAKLFKVVSGNRWCHFLKWKWHVVEYLQITPDDAMADDWEVCA